MVNEREAYLLEPTDSGAQRCLALLGLGVGRMGYRQRVRFGKSLTYRQYQQWSPFGDGGSGACAILLDDFGC